MAPIINNGAAVIIAPAFLVDEDDVGVVAVESVWAAPAAEVVVVCVPGEFVVAALSAVASPTSWL